MDEYTSLHQKAWEIAKTNTQPQPHLLEQSVVIMLRGVVYALLAIAAAIKSLTLR